MKKRVPQVVCIFVILGALAVIILNLYIAWERTAISPEARDSEEYRQWALGYSTGVNTAVTIILCAVVILFCALYLLGRIPALQKAKEAIKAKTGMLRREDIESGKM
jgi:hypothetical protein